MEICFSSSVTLTSLSNSDGGVLLNHMFEELWNINILTIWLFDLRVTCVNDFSPLLLVKVPKRYGFGYLVLCFVPILYRESKSYE